MADTSKITTSDHYIEHGLKQRLVTLGEVFESDVITMIAPMYPEIDHLVRRFVEEIPTKDRPRQKSLSVVLETDGGSVEVVERIAHVMRYHYKDGDINFIVPNRAMSAGTILVMSGDNIFMDYYSVLGPVDPQVPSQTGNHYVPALAYLEKYNELVDKSHKGELSTAELAFMIQRFDLAELDLFKKARGLSTTLLIDWLTKYHLKNWTVTKTRRIPVTDEMKETPGQGNLAICYIQPICGRRIPVVFQWLCFNGTLTFLWKTLVQMLPKMMLSVPIIAFCKTICVGLERTPSYITAIT